MKRTILAAAATAALLTQARALADDHSGYLYTYGSFESRYQDLITSVDAYKTLGSDRLRIRPYVDFSINRDSRTAGGQVPQVFSDNYALGAAGVQYTNAFGLRLFAQAGVTQTIGPVAAVPSGGDVRTGAELYREWGHPALPGGSYGNYYGSAIYYSRYSDTESYNQIEQGTTLRSGAHPIQAFVRTTLTLDSHDYYYANVAEVTGGIRFSEFGTHGPSLEIAQVFGRYLHTGALPSGVQPWYATFRPMLNYGVNL